MKTKSNFIISILVIVLLSSCGSSNKGVRCYSFPKGKTQKTHITKLGFGHKRFKKRKHSKTKIDSENSLKFEVDLNNEVSFALQSHGETIYLVTKNELLYASSIESTPDFQKNNSSSKKEKKGKKKYSKSNKKYQWALKNGDSVPFYKKEIAQSKSTLVKSTEGMLLLYVSLIGALMTALFWFNRSKMVSISRWAKKNAGKAIAAITAIKVSLILSGLFIGKLLAENDLAFSDSTRNILLGSYLTAALFYPIKKRLNQFFKRSYFRQKIHDFALVTSGLFLMICMGNKSSLDANFSPVTTFIFHTYDNNFTDSADNLMYSNASVSNRELDTSYKKNELSTASEIGLTVLAFLVFLVLLYFVAVLACGLSCNGQEGLAVIVGIGGIGGLITALVFVLKSIHKKG